jgi:hypothetical protein
MKRTVDVPPSASTAAMEPNGLRGALLTAAIAGSCYFLLGLATPSKDGPPVATATADQIRTFVTENATALRIATAVGVLSVVTVLMFTAALARQVSSRLPHSTLADLITGGGVLIAVGHWLTTTTESIPLLLPGLIGTELASVDDATLRAWYGLTGFTHFLGDLTVAPIALVLTAFSIAALQGGLLPRWLGWLGLGFAVSGVMGTAGMVVGSKPLTMLWFGGLMGWWLWTLVAGVCFALRWRRVRR